MAAIAWNISAGDASGAGISGSAVLEAGAVTTAAATVEAGNSQALALQLADVTVNFFIATTLT